MGLILSKRLLQQTFSNGIETQLRAELTAIKQCFATDDVPEAIQAFREKRRPVFQGK